MSNLKTLKGLEKHSFSYDNEDGKPLEPINHIFITKCELKQEAIKWIKELNSCMYEPNYDPECVGGVAVYTEQQDQTIMVRWIKHFFNITPDELVTQDSSDQTDETVRREDLK